MVSVHWIFQRNNVILWYDTIIDFDSWITDISITSKHMNEYQLLGREKIDPKK